MMAFDGTGLKRALIAGTAYFLLLFSLGFILGTIRVTILVPRFGSLLATMAEVPFMMGAAFFLCCWVLSWWQVPSGLALRWTMAIWFLLLLGLFETLLGSLLFARSAYEQWSTLITPAGAIGLAAQIGAAALPLFSRRNKST